MAIDELAKSATRSTGPTPNPQEDVNPFLDVLASPFRGVEGAIQGIYDLADYATGDDLLPDYNERFLGRSQTFVGGLGEGVTQFLTGFIPVAGVAGRIGALTKVGKAGKKALNLKGYAAAGAVADFSVFQAQEQRLSNLIQAFPSLANPVNEYLAADDSDGEIEGRFKNTIEGLGIGGLTDSLFMGVKALKRKRGGEADEDILKDLKFNRYRDQELLREDFDTSQDFRDIVDQAFTKAFGKGIVKDGNEVSALEVAKQFNSTYSGELKPVLEALIENGDESLKTAKFTFGPDSGINDRTIYSPSRHAIEFNEGGARTFVHELLHAATGQKIKSEFLSLNKQIDLDTSSLVAKEGDDGVLGSRIAFADKGILEIFSQNKEAFGTIGGFADAFLQTVKALDAEDAVFTGRTKKDIADAEQIVGQPYGLTNLDEFITEAFTNPEFRRVLMEIPSTNQASKTMFDQFMDVIKKMLGVSGNQANLLDDVFKYTDELVKNQNAMFDGSFNFLKSADDLQARMGQRRTLDDRGDDFKVPEGEKAPASEMQKDVAVPMRGRTMGPFKYPVKGNFFGKDLSEIPTPVLKKAMTFNNKALTAGVKNRIQSELNAIEAGYAPYVPFEDTGSRVTFDKKKSKSIPPARPYGEIEGTAPYVDAESYLQAVNQGGVTPKEAYARYLRNRGGTGGKAENNSMRLQEYIENQQILRGEPTTDKNPRIQGKSQFSSDLERAKGKGMPDSITDARLRGRAFSAENSSTMGQRQLDQNIEESIARMANDLETGGDGAIANFARGIRNTTQAVALVQAIAKNLEKAPTAKTVSAEELIAENAELVGTLGGNAGDYAATISKITEASDLSNFRNVQKAVYDLIDAMTIDVVDLANQADEALTNPKLNKQQLEVQLLSTLDQMQEVGRIWSLMGREAGLTLVQRKFLLDPSGKYRIKSGIGFDAKTAQPKDYEKFVNENRAGTMPVEKMVQLLKGSKDKAQAKANIKKAMKNAEDTFGSKAMDVTMEVWMNSLLSGPTTQVVNLLGNSLTLAIRTIEQSVGSLLTGNPQLARATLKYAFDMESFMDVIRISAQTFKSGESRLVQGSKAFEDRQVARRAIAKDGEGTLAKSINMLGTVINVPSRALAFGDEFFKQMNYRSYVKTNLAYDAMKKGAKSGEEVAEYVTKNFDNFITKGARAYNEKGIYMDAVEAAQAQGLKFGKEQEEFIAQYLKDNPFDETRGGLADAAKGYAEETTFTNDLENEGVIGTLSNTLNTLKNKGGAWRTLNFVIPFLRTPTNILKFSIDRTPLGTVGMVATKAKRAELTKQLMSEDPMVRAQIRGKLAVSTAATGAILYYMNTNKGMITGGGPPNRDELESLRMSGWRPYSIKVGDTYYSYQRADPIATVLGLFADIIEGQQYHDVEDIISQDMVALSILSLTQNVTNKSYVKGLDTLLQLVRDPVGNFKPFAGNIVGGFAPTFFTQIQNMADERELKETRTIFDYWLKKMPVAQSTLPSRRNFLGEVITNQNSPYMTGVLNPIYFNKESKDPVDKELAGLQHGFSQPSTKLYNAIEMRDVYNADGRQAFDRYLELSGTTKIGGKTMRQSLREMVKDKGYQALPKESDSDLGELSPRIKAVQRLVRAYRRKGRYEMLEEFPELKDSIYQLQQDKAQYRLIQ